MRLVRGLVFRLRTGTCDNDNDNDHSSSQLPVDNALTCSKGQSAWAVALPWSMEIRSVQMICGCFGVVKVQLSIS